MPSPTLKKRSQKRQTRIKKIIKAGQRDLKRTIKRKKK